MAVNRCPDCQATVTKLITIDGVQVCDRCALRRRLDHIQPANKTGPLRPLREVMLRAEPLTTSRWLNRTKELLHDLNTGRIPLTHDGLDQLPKRKAAEHLRALLIAADRQN